MKLNTGKIENGIYIKFVDFSKAVLWKNREISINKLVAENWLDKVRSVKFIDLKKEETWEAGVEKIKENWIFKKEGQEPQYYIPIDIFEKTKKKTPESKQEKLL